MFFYNFDNSHEIERGVSLELSDLVLAHLIIHTKKMRKSE